MDEWALLPRLEEFPLVVAPEQDNMSPKMVDALKAYVEHGGNLLLSGRGAHARFGAEFLGAVEVTAQANASLHVPTSTGTVQLGSAMWGMLKATTAEPLGYLGKTPLPDAELLEYPAAVLNRVGQGKVLYVPMDLFHFYQRTRYPMVREWLGDLVRWLQLKLDIRVHAPACVDAVLRRKAGRTIIHLINLAPELPNYAANSAASNIPAVGPVVIEYDAPTVPQRISLHYEDGGIERDIKPGSHGTVVIKVARVGIHCAVVIE